MEFGKLHLVATPIGNLEDITFRALETLKNADLIACEDTRHSLKLLNHFDIQKPLTSYFEHNKKEKGEYIVSLLKDGKNVALITDAGTPAISDPGEDLVSRCHDEGIEVQVIPGASAAISAVALSGLGGGRFCFEGFLSVSNKPRKEHLNSLKNETRAMIFYEAPHKLASTLKDLADTFGEDRRIVLARELTKRYEETVRMTIGDAIKKYEDTKPLGEYVLVVEGCDKEAVKEENEVDARTRAAELIEKYKAEGLRNKEILSAVMSETGLKRNEVYEMILEK